MEGDYKMKKLIATLLAAMSVVMLAGCGSGKVIRPKDGYAEGSMGDTMRTYFFDYSVNSAYLCDTFEGYSAKDGYEILVAELTIKNNDSRNVEMYDSDFQIQWGDNAADAFDFSLTFYNETFSNKVFPGTYTLSSKESRTGLLVFEVPAGYSEFSISYLELFETDDPDDQEGDIFFVYFDAARQ